MVNKSPIQSCLVTEQVVEERTEACKMPGLAKVFKFFFILIISLLSVCVLRTYVLRLQRRQHLPPCVPGEDVGHISLDEEIWERFRGALKIPSISYSRGKYDETELLRLRGYILKSYPRIFNASFIQHEIVNQFSLLIEVTGRNRTLVPYMLTGHLDVVPVDKEKWTVDPFAAVEKGEKLYGRGTMDDKGTVIGLLEVVDYMVRTNRQPQRGFFLAFGHDEEVRGENGAFSISKALKKRGINKLHFILDEGFVVVKDPTPFIKEPAAFVGVTEKGYMTVNISITMEGGHSSMPSTESAITIMSKAITRLEDNSMRPNVERITLEQFAGFSYISNFPFNIILSNFWLFKPLIIQAFTAKPHMRAMIQTVGSVTMFQGGIKSNVIPTTAWAIINYRVIGADGTAAVIEHIRRTINDDRVNIEVTQKWESHPVSPHNEHKDLPYQVLHDTIGQIFPDIAIIPANLMANTDCAHYLSFTDAIYRFQPIKITVKESRGIHGHDEYVTRTNFQRLLNFFRHLIANADRTNLRTDKQHEDL